MSRKPRDESTRPSRSPSRRCSRCATASCRRCSGGGHSSRSRAPGRCRVASSPPPRRSRRRSAGISPRRSTWVRSHTWSRSRPTATRGEILSNGRSRPRTWASCHSASTPRSRRTRAGTPSTISPHTAFDHGAIIHSARERLRGKLSYSNIGFALAPSTFTLNELRDVYTAALGYDVSATNLKRVLLRRGALVPTGAVATPAAPAGDPRRSSPSRSRRSRSPIRSPPSGRPIYARSRRARRRPWCGINMEWGVPAIISG